MQRSGLRSGVWVLAALVLTLMVGSCSKDNSSGPVADTDPPAPIVNLSHGTVTMSTVVLNWTAPGDDGEEGTARLYDIRYSLSTLSAENWVTASQVLGEPAPAAPGTAQTMTVLGLAPDTLYTFAIKTADDVPNWSAISNVIEVHTAAPPGDEVPPAAVADLAALYPQATTVLLNWTAPGDDQTTGTAAQYQIRYSTAPITSGNFAAATLVTGAPMPLLAGTVQNVDVNGLTPETHYYFAMMTADEVPNWSGLSNVAEATTSAVADGTPPAAVADLEASALTPTSIDLSWTSPGDDDQTGTAAQYDIRYSTAPITAENFSAATIVSGAPAPMVAGSAQQVTVTSLAPETTYYFAMKTADEALNWSELSNVAQATTPAAPDLTPPADITNLAAGLITSTSVELSWTSPGDDGDAGTAAHYDLRYSALPITLETFDAATQVTGEPVPAVAGTLQSMTVVRLLPDTPYYFAIKTADEAPNWSALSNVVQVATSPPPDDVAPAAITDLAATVADPHTAYLTWTAPGDDGTTGTATAYDVRYATSPITDVSWDAATVAIGVPAPQASGTAEHLSLGSLSADTDYYFAIKTADDAGNLSGLSNVPQVHITAPVPPPPTIIEPVFPDSVCITSTDPYAVLAKTSATNQIGTAQALSSLAHIFMRYLDSTAWQQSGDCWLMGVTVEDCTTSFEGCLTDQHYILEATNDGVCYGDLYDNSLVFEASVFLDTRVGYFTIFETNSDNPTYSWSATWAADMNSGSYEIHNGSIQTPTTSYIQWSRSADGDYFEVTYTVRDVSRWIGRFWENPCHGLFTSYVYDTAQQSWEFVNDIGWYGDGTGFYDVYEGHTRTEHHTW
jgi:chitodextrinase